MCGGFPCTDLSIGGYLAGILDGDSSVLWRSYHRLIDEGRPKYAIIENVRGWLSGGLEVVLQDLAHIGYDATWTTLDTRYFGLPQRRSRVYVLAVRDGIPAEADVFQLSRRNTARHRHSVGLVDKQFTAHCEFPNQAGRGFAYFTRQRIDQFAERGLSSTLAKRDYKQFTDVVWQDGRLRRVTPSERMALQGFDPDWLEGCGLTKTQMFQANGMSVPVVKYIGERVQWFDELYG
jgi:site-specific DNA-cytosine methylase